MVSGLGVQSLGLGGLGFIYGLIVNIGALIIRIGLWGPLYYNYNKEPPK